MLVSGTLNGRPFPRRDFAGRNAPRPSGCSLCLPVLSSGEFFIYAIPIGLVLVGAVGFMVFKATGGDSGKALRGMGLASVVNHWVFWAVSIGFALLPLYKVWQAASPPSKSKLTHHAFSKDGIEMTGSDGSSKAIEWQVLSQVVETKKGFLFYRQGKLATFVPLRSLSGAAEIEIVRKFVRQNVSNAALQA